jgi:hypothetical protein
MERLPKAGEMAVGRQAVKGQCLESKNGPGSESARIAGTGIVAGFSAVVNRARLLSRLRSAPLQCQRRPPSGYLLHRFLLSQPR